MNDHLLSSNDPVARRNVLFLSLILVGLLAMVDYITGPEFAFSIFYLLPVAAVVWQVGLGAGLGFSVLAGLTWFIVDLASRPDPTPLLIHGWNAAVRTGFFIIVTVILNQRRQLEARLRSAKEEAERLSATLDSANKELSRAMTVKTQFTSMVSHELRTPLTAIKEGIGIVLEGEAGPVNTDQRDLLELSQRNLNRLHALINNVLDFSRLEAGKEKFDPRPHELHRIVEDVLRTFEHAFSARGLTLRTSLDPAVGTCTVDDGHLVRILNNLLSNALKFTASGSVTLSTRRTQDGVELEVADTGPGIPKEDADRLFEEFVQLTSGGYRRTGSTGLGLSITRALARQHGGDIRVESALGEGSRFIVFLPSHPVNGHA